MHACGPDSRQRVRAIWFGLAVLVQIDHHAASTRASISRCHSSLAECVMRPASPVHLEAGALALFPKVVESHAADALRHAELIDRVTRLVGNEV